MKWLLSALLAVMLVAPQIAGATCTWVIPSGGLIAGNNDVVQIKSAAPGILYVCTITEAAEATTNLAVTDCGSNSKLYNPDDDNASLVYRISSTRELLVLASDADTTISTPYDYAKVYGGIFNATISGRVQVTMATDELTSSGTAATYTDATDHGFVTNDVVVIAGATPEGYNGTYVVTRTSDTVLTYTMNADGGDANATGTVTFTETFNVEYYCAKD